MSEARERETPAEESRLLEDFRLERWLASARSEGRRYGAADTGFEDWTANGASARSGAGTGHLSAGSGYHWTQRAQYAVGHAINRYYAAEPRFRVHADIGELVDYRWPRRIEDFDSEESYWAIKDRIAANLASFFASNEYESERPVVLYEQFAVRVPELEMDLSMIFQLAWQGKDGEGLHLQKFVVEYDPDVLEGYRHAARVFCYRAFGAEPSRIEVYTVLGGERILLEAAEGSYEDSLDYLRLAYSGMEEAEEQRSCSCSRCRQESEPSRSANLC
ncbi:hypothetical protein QWJ34_25085 [Saccharibacillus sp. CPCC 101409]|uniref:hypothetical protein n=1 Tax=Saccharibacillus sp. CPCC 101409 TaxID=3058041 RepID=UPI0026724D98|nr:hypothetical protein [Saccharibacillus sp. CPCC 101409]MDO3413061.1 hypothetical protein [Saccharibacillus sp. CPCC 101409]